jgi:cytidylate kinase
MNVIRGAITITADTPEEIREKTAILLDRIKKDNHLTDENTKAIVFSLTQDIHSYYPAKAARECGFEKAALFSAVEPNIDGALPLCIRVMVLAEGLQEEKHAYLGGAARLRKDIAERLNIALDGPAGSGKSTIAKSLAASYHILYLDTGAMYRACALYFRRHDVSLEDAKEVEKALKGLDLSVKYLDGVQHTYLGEEDVSEAIRKNEISMMASKVATNGAVRKKMVEAQREVAARQSCVLDGRDIGTAVLPDTPYKFYVTADARVRAERRLKELREKGNTEITFPELLAEIEKRDEQDMNREFSPLRKAEDATLIDTTDLTVEEAVATIRNKIQERI